MLCYDIHYKPGEPNQTYDFCDYLEGVVNYATLPLWIIMLVPILCVIFVTMVKRNEAEDAHWFIFHCAIMDLIVNVSRILLWIFPDLHNTIVQAIMIFGIDIASNSILLLAFTRFFTLYFPHFYRKVVKKTTLIYWMIGFDVLIGFGLEILDLNSKSIALKIFYVLIMSSLFLFVILVFIKIVSMRKLAKSSSERSSLRRLNHAAFLCLFQAFVHLFFLCSIFYNNFFELYFISSSPPGTTLFTIHMLLLICFTPNYQFSVILDNIATLLIVKSYRTCLLKSFKNMIHGKWKVSSTSEAVGVNGTTVASKQNNSKVIFYTRN